VFRITSEISRQTFPLVLDIDHPKFKPGLDRLVRIANDTAAAKAQGGFIGGVKKLLCNLDAGITFARLYFLPAKPNEMPAEIRMAPIW
jgi:magnesium-protoporphyrin IX monomethyl ester (oxidative) cyclase